MSIITSAPGKTILFGEHAVVYDKIGIACAIDKRCFVRVSFTPEDNIFIEAKNLNLRQSLSKEKLFEKYSLLNNLIKEKNFLKLKELTKKEKLLPSFFVIANILKKYGFEGLKVEIASEIPKNLGSSSAVFSAIALAVSKILGKDLSKKEISDFAFQGDVIAHGGMPSGIDNNVVTYGGYIQFRKSEGVKFLNIDFQLPLIIVDSGEPAKTAETVLAVRELREKEPEFVIPILDKLEEISLAGIGALKLKNLPQIGKLMTDYYLELRKLGISTKKLDEIFNLALENKALGAKPTGGWGGGCCLVLAKGKKESLNLIRVFEEKGFQTLKTKLGVEGVKRENA